MKYHLIITKVAGARLDELYYYVAQNAGETTATYLVEGVGQLIAKLADYPRFGRSRVSAKIPNLHTVPKGKAVIAYTVDDETSTVTILDVFYGGQDYESYLEIETSGE